MPVLKNLRLRNSDGDFVTYTSILFFSEAEWDLYDMDSSSGGMVRSGNDPSYMQYYNLINEICEERTGYPELIKYGKPIVSGLTSNANQLTASNGMAYAFATAIPTIFAPFGPWRQGQTTNEIILNGERFAFFGTSGNNEAGAYTTAGTLAHYLNPIPDTTSKVVMTNSGTIAQQQQGSTLWCYFICCRVTDIDDPWDTIDKWKALRIGLYYGASKWLFCETSSGAVADNTTYQAFLEALQNTDPVDRYIPGEGDDPNEGGGISETGGGENATFDDTSDPIDIPTLNGLTSVVDTGFVTIYNPSIQELKALSSYMWNANPTTIEFWKHLVADPLDLIIGLNLVPCPVQDGPSQNVMVGFIDTGVQMRKAASQYVELDCGTITVQPYWDNVMDYSPFTKAQIYLPMIGVQDLNIDEIMGKPLKVVYHIDILSCSCTCFVKCGDSVLYTFMGQCGQNIPVSAANYTQMVAGVLQLAGAAVAVGVTGGAAAPAAAAGIASSASGTTLNGVAIEMTDPMQTGIPAGAPGGGMVAKSSGGGGNAVHGTMQTVGNVMALKPSFAHSGSISGPGGQLAYLKPYLILERPRQSLPKDYKKYRGYPSNITAKLSDLTGYTEVDAIHLDGIPATAAEIQEIDKLLKSGVIL